MWGPKKTQVRPSGDDVGVHVRNVIDSVIASPDSQTFKLVMVQKKSWDDVDLATRELAAKIDLYLEYLESGRFYTDRPDAVGKTVYIELWCFAMPTGPFRENIERFHEAVVERGFEMKLHVTLVD